MSSASQRYPPQRQTHLHPPGAIYGYGIRTVAKRTYGHVIDELEDAPHLAAEDAIRQARERLRVGKVSADDSASH